jgi:glycosyltransferase involved in cell wall biosynthesis
MKILIDHQLPFLLAHGGLQIQIQRTKAALESLGVEVEYLRFWDEDQTGDAIHFFGRCSKGYIELAQGKEMAVVMSELLSGTGSRSRKALFAQKSVIRLARHLLATSFVSRMGWEAFSQADAVIALTPWEAHLMLDLFHADREKLHVVPNGVDDCFFKDQRVTEREGWLVCTATIAPRKRIVALAEAAVVGRVRIRIFGKPYSEQDPYHQRFLAICKSHPDLVEFCGSISDRKALARVYSHAAGFVLLSTMESLSLSALEAAAAGCRLLLSDLPWARSTFGNDAVYCPVHATRAQTANILRAFSENISAQPKPPIPWRWADVANELIRIYTGAIRRLG